MQHETTTWNGEPAIRVRLDYDEAREYLALDEDAIAHLDSLTASERNELTLELNLVPLREVAESGYPAASYTHVMSMPPTRRSYPRRTRCAGW